MAECGVGERARDREAPRDEERGRERAAGLHPDPAQEERRVEHAARVGEESGQKAHPEPDARQA